MKKFLTYFTFILFLNEGHICWSNAKYQTDHILANSDIECLGIPLEEQAYSCIADFVENYLEINKEDE